MTNNAFHELYEAALKKQRPMLIERAPDRSHDQTIESAIDLNKSDDEFSTLIQYVFSHHDITDFRRAIISEVEYDNGGSISRFFHEKYFDPVKIVQDTDPNNPALTQGQFIERISKVKWGSGANQISFLVGGIGSGKTTFLCNTIYRNFQNLLHSKKIPIKINVDIENNHEVRPLEETLSVIINSILTILAANQVLSRTEVERLRRECGVALPCQLPQLDSALCHLLELLKERHKLELILIIDNIDYLYHLGDRGFFCDQQHEDQANAYKAITDLVTYFWRKRGQFRAASLGISVLFSVRKDTIDFIKSKQREVPLPGLNDTVYSLVDRGKEGAVVTLSSRFALLKEIAEKVPEPRKRDEFLAATSTLSSAYSKPSRAGARLFDDIWSLCRRGLRDVIDQMADYAWLEFNDERRAQATLRFSTQYYPSMIAYCTDGYRRYSQFRGNVPNLFLVNAPSRNNEFGVPKEFKENHFFTLWLKYLITSYIRAKEKETLRTDDVVHVFSGKNKYSYPETLVRYLLGALSEVPDSEIVEVDVSADGDGGTTGFVRDLNVTKRGRFLLDGFAFSFSYLQMVVDDWRLRLPRELASDFDYLQPDYRYLVAEEGEYGKNVRQVVEGKGRQAVFFGVLLEETLIRERKSFPKVFERISDAGVALPEYGSISRRVLQDVKRAAQYVGANSEIFEPENSSAISFRERCSSALDRLFEPCMEMNRRLYDL